MHKALQIHSIQIQVTRFGFQILLLESRSICKCPFHYRCRSKRDIQLHIAIPWQHTGLKEPCLSTTQEHAKNKVLQVFEAHCFSISSFFHFYVIVHGLFLDNRAQQKISTKYFFSSLFTKILEYLAFINLKNKHWLLFL